MYTSTIQQIFGAAIGALAVAKGGKVASGEVMDFAVVRSLSLGGVYSCKIKILTHLLIGSGEMHRQGRQRAMHQALPCCKVDLLQHRVVYRWHPVSHDVRSSFIGIIVCKVWADASRYIQSRGDSRSSLNLLVSCFNDGYCTGERCRLQRVDLLPGYRR